MKIKKPSWIDENPYRAGKRLSNIYWGEYPVWKRDEEILKWATLDEELLIYNHTFIYYHRGVELSRESFKTQGSQNIVYHIPSGYILEDSTFKPKKHGVNKVNIIKESYNIKFICKHADLATPIEIIIKKPENATMTVESARNELISNPLFPSGYDIDVPNFIEFPDNLIVDNDLTYNVPLKIGTASPKPIKKVTIKYYLIDDNGDQSIYKTETHRYLAGTYDYNISIPVGYEQTNRVDNDENNTSIYIKAKIYNINIRLATYKNGNINRVWHTYKLERKYNETVAQTDLQPLPDNLKIGVAPNLFKVTLQYLDNFNFVTRTITEDLNIDIEVKASLKMVEIITDVNIPRIDESGVGIYTYGLPTGFIKANSIKTIKLKFIANRIGISDGDKVFAAIFPFNPVKQTINGNGIELVTGKTISMNIVKDTNFIHKLKTEFSGDFNGNVNNIAKIEYIELNKPNGYNKEIFGNETTPVVYVSDNFHKDEFNPDRTLKSKWDYIVFNNEFDWTLLDTADVADYDKSHKCWIIISNMVLHPIPSFGFTNHDVEILKKSIACGIPCGSYPDKMSEMPRSIHGTLPSVQIYENTIDIICPLVIKDYRYYLCDNATDFITDVKFKVKTPIEYAGGATPEVYNRNIIANAISITNDIIHTYNHDTNKVYSSIVKDNPVNMLPNKFYGHILPHLAFNWYKHYCDKSDILDPALEQHMNKWETGMVILNYWDMVNHAIGKSLLRNHTVDEKLEPYLTKFNKDISIFVNLQLLPVMIDITNDKFPKIDVSMEEKDFGVGVFNNKKPIISFSPINIKRIFNDIPRFTYIHKFIPEKEAIDENGGIRGTLEVESDLLAHLGPTKKLYKYRPELYESSAPHLLAKISKTNTFSNRYGRFNLRNLYKKYILNPMEDYKFISDYDGEYLINNQNIDLFVKSDDLVTYNNIRGKLVMGGTNFLDDRALNAFETNYDPLYNTKLKEILDYNNSITIFNVWKEEISYDNPQ